MKITYFDLHIQYYTVVTFKSLLYVLKCTTKMYALDVKTHQPYFRI